MSTNPGPILKYEQKNLELILKVAQKTLDGKVEWTKTASTLSASLAGGLHASFKISTTMPIAFLRGLSPENWLSFEIKNESGNYLVSVENQGILVNALKGDMNTAIAAQKLFEAIVQLATADLDRAIDAVDKM